MNITRRITGVFIGVAALAGPSMLMASPAEASIGDCASGQMCAWAAINYNGARKAIPTTNVGNWGVWGEPSCTKYFTWNDCASSLYNHTSTRCYRFYAAAYTSTPPASGYHTLSKGDTIANLGSWAYNDVISASSSYAC